MLRVTSKYKARVETQFDGALHHLEELQREPNWKEEEGLFRALRGRTSWPKQNCSN